MRKTIKLKQSNQEISHTIIAVAMIAIALVASLSTYALTYKNLNHSNQIENTIPTYTAQGNLVIRVQNPGQQQVHLEQNGSIYVNDVIKNVLKCDGKDVAFGALIGLDANQTIELTVDFQSKVNEQLSIKIVTLEGGDLVSFTQTTTTTASTKSTVIPVASVFFTSGSGGSIDPSGTIAGIAVGTTYPLTAMPSNGYYFSSWTFSGPISVRNAESISTIMYITGPGMGSITANFIRAPDPRIVITSGASQSIYAELLSSPIVIQRQDSQNRPITTGTAIVNLASTSAGCFYSDAAGINQVSLATISDGSSSVTFWYKDISAGTPTLTASSNGYSSLSTTFTIKSLKGISVWDQTGQTSPWALMILGVGNSGTLTAVSPGYNDSYSAQLTCTAFPSTQGAIAQQYWFDTLNVGQTYTCTFYYKSNVNFMAYYFSASGNWTGIYSTGVECEASSSWKAMTLQIGPIQSATYYWLSFNLYSVGQAQVDNISFGPTN